MACSKRMAGCPVTCGHRCIVEDYRAERERQYADAVERAGGYDAELADELPGLITFRRWLRGRAGRAA
jgi:hypothetical protein